MDHSKPIITSSKHVLPFERLSPLDFERLCLWLVEREGYEKAEHLGAAGSEQGRDIIAWRDGNLWAFQCKRVRRFGRSDASEEVKKVLALPKDQRPVGLVFVVACDVSAATRQKAREICGEQMQCHFWVSTELDMRVKRHPDIVAEFFHEDSFAKRVLQALTGGTEAQRALRNRQAMLKLVHNTWIKGVLEQSLHGAAMIELGMEERADVVERPWDMVVQMPDQSSRQLPHGTRIADIFDDMNQSLLILGEPGSGKTTTLLEFARDTIARAERDPAEPIPVVFNPSSWSENRLPIAEWLVQELKNKYYVRERLARLWVENDELLLLLDGLDEVKLGAHEDCVHALNAFCQAQQMPVVICSRTADYEVLTTKLKLHGAVVLQPLRPEQIDTYLAGTGVELLAVRKTLEHDRVLQDLAQTPLMLSIMVLAYRGMSAEDLGSLSSNETRRRHLFTAYVQQMFERRGADQQYTSEQTVHWLAWLAPKMSEHAQTLFLIEGLQPEFLGPAERRQVRLIACLFFALDFGLLLGLASGLAAGLTSLLLGGLASGLASLLAQGVVFGLVLGLLLGLIGGLAHGLSGGWDSIKPVEKLRWSWKRVPVGLIGGTVGGLLVGLLVEPVVGLFLGLVIGLITGLESGLTSDTLETKTIPNQGMRQSAKNAAYGGLFVGLTGGLVAGLVGGLVSGLVGGLAAGVFVGLGGGMVFGLVGGLIYGPFSGGGMAVIKHLALRYVLWRNDYAPWRYARFLDYASERIFLRKVGGGYIFVHRLLQEYFASLWSEGEVRQ